MKENRKVMDKPANKDLRYQPLYSSREVSRYARVQPSTMRSWIQTDDKGIIVPAAHHVGAPLSFINLIESHVLVALRRSYHVPMQKIRKALKWAEKTYKTDHPLAMLDFETDGSELFIKEMGFSINASRGGQIALPKILSQYLHRIERDPSHLPIRFYPLTYETSPKVIVIDPAIAYGRPVIEGTRVTTVMVFERYSGGESLNDIADDYDLKLPQVEEALRCEIDQRAA